MIAFLSGTLAEKLPTHVVMDVGGVGYHVVIPVSTYDILPPVGETLRILTHFVVREDAQILYGFLSDAERDLFRLLVPHVTGVGPKTALDVLSGSTVSSFKACVVAGDAVALSKIKGIGKKTAERIILELKDKVGVAAAWEAASAAPTQADARIPDAVLALIALGYKQAEAKKSVEAAAKDCQGAVGDLVSKALRALL